MITEEWLRTLLHIEDITLDFVVPKAIATGMRYVFINHELDVDEILISSDQETGELIGLVYSESKGSYIIKDPPSAGLILYCIRGRKGRTSQMLLMSRLTVLLFNHKTAQTNPESLPCEEEN